MRFSPYDRSSYDDACSSFVFTIDLAAADANRWRWRRIDLSSSGKRMHRVPFLDARCALPLEQKFFMTLLVWPRPTDRRQPSVDWLWP